MNVVREFQPPPPPGRDSARVAPAMVCGASVDDAGVHGLPPHPASQTPGVRMGDWLAQMRPLLAEDLLRIGQHQTAHGLRFGEAAVALGLVSTNDVERALSRQFRYPHQTDGDAPGKHGLGAELVTLADPFGVAAEHFRSLRSQLAMPLSGRAVATNTLAITSLDRSDGRSWCAANLAVSMAQRDGPVLLVDADLRSPRQHRIFGLGEPAGLSSLLDGRADLGLVQAVPQVPGLFVLAAGAKPPNPLELLERSTFTQMLAEVGQRFVQVVVDSPALTCGADASVVAARAQSSLLVLRRHVSQHSRVQDCLRTWARSGTAVAGVMLNDH